MTEWQAYYRISPWDADRIEYLLAEFMVLYANCHRSKRGRKYKLNDFLMFMKKSQAEQEDEEFDRIFNETRRRIYGETTNSN